MLDDEQKRILSKICRQILTVLEDIAKQAQTKLSRSSSTPLAQTLAVGTNTMVDSDVGIQNLAAILLKNRENLKRLEREPSVARLVVLWEDEENEETLYVSRASVAGIGIEIPGAKLATYTSPIGRLAELKPGESITIKIGHRVREAHIQERVELHPKRCEEQWDTVDNRFEFELSSIPIESVLLFLQQLDRPSVGIGDIPDVLGVLFQQEMEAKLIREKLRRGVIERIALRDQPILDRYQGEIFRMPLDQRLVLLGPPGTGKTTTLIRRLAQKKTPDGITDEESEILLKEGLKESFIYSDSWVMFSPTELLKLYLRDAFNREGVPARDDNLRTWDKERLSLGRNVLGILRSTNPRDFKLDETATILSDNTSGGLQQLYEEFAPYFETLVFDHCTEALNQLRVSEDGDLRERLIEIIGLPRGEERFSVREIANLVEQTSELQPELKRLDDEIKAELRNLGNRLLRDHPKLLEELAEALPLFSRDDEDEEDEEEGEEVEDDATALQHKEPRSKGEQLRVAANKLLNALRRRAHTLALGGSAVSGQAGLVIELLGDRLPPHEALARLGARIRTRTHLRTLMRSPRQFVMGVPRAYARFRRQVLKEQHLFEPDASDAIKQRLISPGEVDVLILTMLRNTRRLLGLLRLAPSSSHDWLESIRGRYLMQVFVDEATDLSAVQLACTIELSHPRLRSWFACGDLDLRTTSYGIRDRAQIEWIGQMCDASVEVRGVNIGYRQSRRLRELAIALSTHTAAGGVSIEAPEEGEDADVWPLLAENHDGDRLAQWLTDRITEVERAVGKLPSIAIFVKDEDSIEPIVQLIHPILADHNIPVVGCKDGRVVGDKLEVRVFDVRHIKGLEFEAVFFVGIDQLAERLPDLFDRFFYVGASRAATYLGITCVGCLPANLEHVRKHFDTGGWHI